MTARKPLSDAQKRILSNAVTHPDRGVFPLPIGFHARGAVRQKVLASLLKLGLACERPTTDDGAVWRRDGRRHRLTLTVTSQGARAIGLDDDTVIVPVTPVMTASEAPGGKLGLVLSALTSADGFTLAALVTLTGWLPHTTRAALCRLRQRGYPIRLIGDAGNRAYRLDQPAQG